MWVNTPYPLLLDILLVPEVPALQVYLADRVALWDHMGQATHPCLCTQNCIQVSLVALDCRFFPECQVRQEAPWVLLVQVPLLLLESLLCPLVQPPRLHPSPQQLL